MKKIIISTFIIAIFQLYLVKAQQLIGAITVSDLQQEIGFLASDSLKGRKPGTAEDLVAAKYILKCFQDAALKPLYDNGFQKFEIVSDIKAGKKNMLAIGKKKMKLGADYNPLSFSANAKSHSIAAFVGYGFDIALDSLQWNDYQGINVQGKWVIILRGDPEPEKSNSLFIPFEQERAKVVTAKDKGAIGVLFVTPSDMDKNDVVMTLQYDNSPSDAGIPVFSITRAVADKLLLKSNTNVANLEHEIKTAKKPKSFLLQTKINAQSEIIKRKVVTQNVVAMVEGKHPELKNEYVVVGAHFDHLGFGGSGSGSRQPDVHAIHNGADDNASGTAGVIELAHYFSNMKTPPDRSIIFVSFTGEEMGMLGSKEFVKHPPVPLKNITAMINMDMIGRLNNETAAISVGGTGTSNLSDSLMKLVENNYDFKVNHSPDGYGPSDHASFYSENIPVFYFTTGAHEDYHTPTDDTEKINFKGEVKVLEMISKLIHLLADKTVTLSFKESGAKQTARFGRNLKVTLGIIPDMVSAENNGLGVDGVRKGGPADRAGIIKGDRVVSIDNQAVTNIYEYMARLSKLKPGQITTVEIIRNGKKEMLIVQF